MKINNRVVIMREAVSKIVKMLSSKSINVTQRGSRAYVQYHPTTNAVLRINLPYIPDDASDELLDATQGFLDHEVAHILFTDPAVVAKAAKTGVHDLWNPIEDSFIERKMARQFAGSGSNMSKVGKFVLDRYIDDALAKKPEAAPAILLMPMIRAWAGQALFQDYMSDKWHLVAELVEKLGPDAKDMVANAESSQDCLKAATEFKKRLSTPKPAPAPTPAPPPMTPPPSDPSDSEGSDEGEEEQDSKEATEPGDQDGDKSGSDAAELNESPEEPGDQEEQPEPADYEDPEQPEEPADDESEQPEPAEQPEPGEDKSEEQPAGEEPEPEESTGEQEQPGEQPESPETPEEPEQEEGEGISATGDGDSSDDDDDGAGDAPSSSTEEEEGDEEEEQGDQEEGESSDDGHSGSGAEEGIGEPETPPGEQDDTIPPQPPEPTMMEQLEEMGGVKDFDEIAADELTKATDTTSRGSDYRVYTKDFDKIELLEVKNKDAARECLKDLQETVDGMVGVMQKDMERIMAARSAAVWTGGHRSGRLDGRSLSRLRFGQDDIFRRKQENRTKDVAVTLLIDASGSMRRVAGGRRRIDTAVYTAYGVSAVLQRMGIAHEILAFTTTSMPADAAQEMWDEITRTGIRPSRTDALWMPIIKPFNGTLDQSAKERMVGLYNGEVYNCENVDGECVQIAAHRLSMRREARKIMLVLSDGMPACDGTSEELDDHLKSVVKAIEKSGKVDLVGVGIQSTDVRKYYSRNIVLQQLEDLPGAVMKQLKDLLFK